MYSKCFELKHIPIGGSKGSLLPQDFSMWFRNRHRNGGTEKFDLKICKNKVLLSDSSIYKVENEHLYSTLNEWFAILEAVVTILDKKVGYIN